MAGFQSTDKNCKTWFSPAMRQAQAHYAASLNCGLFVYFVLTKDNYFGNELCLHLKC